MNKYNANVLAEAKEEYQRQLVTILSPEFMLVLNLFMIQYITQRNSDKNILKKFQKLLANIPMNQIKLIQNIQE